MIIGSCLCGSVEYEISGDIVHCHCETCRKAHGAAFSSVASVNPWILNRPEEISLDDILQELNILETDCKSHGFINAQRNYSMKVSGWT